MCFTYQIVSWLCVLFLNKLSVVILFKSFNCLWDNEIMLFQQYFSLKSWSHVLELSMFWEQPNSSLEGEEIQDQTG